MEVRTKIAALVAAVAVIVAVAVGAATSGDGHARINNHDVNLFSGK